MKQLEAVVVSGLPEDNLMIKLAVFDFDSTLMDGETIEFLADAMGIKTQVAQITKSAMEGHLDFFESLTKRVSLLKGLPLSKVNEITSNLPYMEGAKELIQNLKRMGYTVICFSGGFRSATIPAQKILGYDAEFANILHSKDGLLTGMVGGEMMFSDSKGKMLQRLQQILSVSKENTIAVGDGANDLSMFEYAGLRIAFCAKDILKKNADIVIEEKNLLQILDKI